MEYLGGGSALDLVCMTVLSYHYVTFFHGQLNLYVGGLQI